MPRFHNRGNDTPRVQFTPEEEAARDLEEQQWASKSGERKLAQIKIIRLIKLNETDYLAHSDMTMMQAMKDYRQGMRDIPQNNSTDEEYDLILARDDSNNLTHAIWSKP